MLQVKRVSVHSYFHRQTIAGQSNMYLCITYRVPSNSWAWYCKTFQKAFDLKRSAKYQLTLDQKKSSLWRDGQYVAEEDLSNRPIVEYDFVYVKKK